MYMKTKYSLYPITNLPVWELYKYHQSLYWTSEECDFTEDKNTILKLNKDELFFVKMILSFFATADGLVNENLNFNFINEFEEQEIKCFYGFQGMIENIHSETYSLLLDTYIKDEKEREECQDAIENIPCIKKKSQFMFKYMDSDNLTIEERLIAFACVEGIFFCGSFCAIYWLKKRGHQNGLTFSNELISRDEKIHTDFACLLYKQMDNQLNEDKVFGIIREAVDTEKEFICESLPCSLLGMNSDLMTQYIKYVADELLINLGYNKLFKINNPFNFMESLKMDGKSNFFEKKVSEYQRTFNMNDEWTMDADF